jgi:3-oxoacyl-[acyl-carrier protein] reductase
MEINLTGKTALVTGGTGIGGAIALALARCGVDLVVTYLTHEEGARQTVEAVRAAGVQAHLLRLDATDSTEANTVVAQAAGLLGGHIDILVNNAGSLVGRVPVTEMTDAYWRQVMTVNLDTTFYVTRAVLPYMQRGWGRIINLSSLAGRNGGGRHSTAYAAAKAGVLGFTRGLAKELGPLGITVNALAPGLILGTPFHETFTAPEAIPGIVAGIAVGRAGTPEDVAGAVVYLASELGAFVTGEVVEINGGSWFV